MELTADKLERLVFVKYLLNQAEKQKELERPLSSSAILTLHDLVECFLQLGYEHLAQKPKLNGNNILDTYTEKLNEILLLNSASTINKAYIKRLNEIRNQLKHATVFVDKRNIHNLYIETENFINDFSKIFFDLNFKEVSLINIIVFDNIKNYLSKSEKLILENRLKDAIVNIVKSYYEYKILVTSLKNKKGRDIANFYNHNVDYTRRYRSSFGSNDLEANLKNSLEEVAKDINKIYNRVSDIQKAQFLSVDIRKYHIFLDIIPRCNIWHNSGEDVYDIEVDEYEVENTVYTLDETKFCFDFVLETVLNYQSTLTI